MKIFVFFYLKSSIFHQSWKILSRCIILLLPHLSVVSLDSSCCMLYFFHFCMFCNMIFPTLYAVSCIMVPIFNIFACVYVYVQSVQNFCSFKKKKNSHENCKSKSNLKNSHIPLLIYPHIP